VLTLNGSLTYGWDSRNRLASLAGAATASFGYGALARRNGKTINGTATNFLYDGANAVQELASGTPTANLLTGLGIDEVFSRPDRRGTRSFVTDALGTTVTLTNGVGAVMTSYAYEPYGNTTVSGEVNGNPAQYTGRENDGTGPYYYRARYYHPGFSRFVAEDPVGFTGGDNLYAYVNGNPISRSIRLDCGVYCLTAMPVPSWRRRWRWWRPILIARRRFCWSLYLYLRGWRILRWTNGEHKPSTESKSIT
jgi:RHS repeat-associated protein